jgi:dipeptidase D
VSLVQQSVGSGQQSVHGGQLGGPDRAVWEHFLALTRIPRATFNEAGAVAYAAEVAARAGAETCQDAFGNLVVKAAASPGREGAPAVCIQAHLDMVCEKRPEIEHDFARDPIRTRTEGEWLYGSGTTLGADNGIGAALALATLTDPSVEHGPLELLFTLQEEIGLHGAAALDGSLVESRLLINLDTEDPEELIVGCAGGATASLFLPAERTPAPEGWQAFRITVSGLQGGHSGIEIHKPLANAVKLLAHALQAAKGARAPLRLGAVNGGNAHNAIPRDASGVLAAPEAAVEELKSVLQWLSEELGELWMPNEPGFRITFEAVGPEPLFGEEASHRILELLTDLPHGVLRMSSVFPGKVETSCNLATLRTTETGLEITASIRSFVNDEIAAEQDRIARRARGLGAEVELQSGYPGWEPVLGSSLQRRTETLYNQLFQAEPRVEVIHAGLECGVIASRVPGMEAISFGPRIEGAHTPEERVHIPSVGRSWQLLSALLADLSAPSAVA